MIQNTGTNPTAGKFIEAIRGRIAAGLPPDVDPVRWGDILAEYLFRNPALMGCERVSLENAIIDAAMMGIELGPPFELATIIPYKDRKENGPPRANLVVEYRGHMIQVYKTGRIKSIEARPVYDKDLFEYRFGRHPILNHQPSNEPLRGELVNAYAIAQLTGGGSAIEVITRHEADRARADSPGSDRAGSLWKTRTAEMWTKTAIKKLVNRMPRAPASVYTRTSKEIPVQVIELLNAIAVSPELYKSALNDLDLECPSDLPSVAAILSRMRTLYRRQRHTEKKDNKEPSHAV